MPKCPKCGIELNKKLETYTGKSWYYCEKCVRGYPLDYSIFRNKEGCQLDKDLIKKLDYAVGQKLESVLWHHNDIWLTFEDDVIIIKFPVLECRCINCAEKDEFVKDRKRL